MKRYSNCSLTFSHTSIDKENGKSKEIKNSIGLFDTSANKTNFNSNQEKSSFFDIKDSATGDQEKKSEIKSGNSLFGDSTSLKINNNSSDNNNKKSLFSSNITDENKKEEKNSSLFKDKKENKLEQSTSLFGDLNRFKKKEEGKPLFSAPTAPAPENSDKSKDNEKSKGLFASPIKETKNNNLTDNKNETQKKILYLVLKKMKKKKIIK